MGYGFCWLVRVLIFMTFLCFVLDVPVNEAQVIIYIKSINGIKMPEEIEVSKIHNLNDWRTDNLTNNRQLFNCDNRQIEMHQLLITSLHSQ